MCNLGSSASSPSPPSSSARPSPVFIDSYHPSRDPIFLFLSKDTHTATASGYLPSADRWIHFHFPDFVAISAISTQPSAVARTLILAEEFGQYVVINPFSRDRPPQLLPPVFNAETWHRVLALIEDSPSDSQVIWYKVHRVAWKTGLQMRAIHSL